MKKETTVVNEFFPDVAAHIDPKREDTRMAVATLLQMSKLREEKLMQNQQIPRYFYDFREFMAWASEIIIKITLPDLVTNITGTEILIARDDAMEGWMACRVCAEEFPSSPWEKKGSVIGGDPVDGIEYFNTMQRREEEHGRDVCASARTYDTPTLRGETYPFEVKVTILNPRHDVRTFHEEIKPIEMNVNKKKIEALGDTVTLGDLTTTANVAAINRNFFEHQHKQYYQKMTTSNHQQRRVGKVESFMKLYDSSKRKSALGNHSHSRKSYRQQEQGAFPTTNPIYNEWTGLPLDPSLQKDWLKGTIFDINVHKGDEGETFTMPVEAEPYYRAMKLPMEDCWNQRSIALVQQHQLQISKLPGRERRYFYKELMKQDLLKDGGKHKNETQRLSSEDINCYRKQLQMVDSSCFEERKEGGLHPKYPMEKMQRGDIVTPFQQFLSWFKTSRQTWSILVDQMGIEAGIKFARDALGITLTRPPFSMASDGDCLLNAVALDPSIKRTRQENAEHGTYIRQVIFTEAIEVVNNMDTGSMESLRGMVGARSKQELIQLLEIYKCNGQWEGDIGDMMPQLVSSFTNTPLFLINIDVKNDKIIGQFVDPSLLFEQSEINHVPKVIVRQNNHYNRLLLPRDAEQAMTLIYQQAKEEQLGTSISLPFFRASARVIQPVTIEDMTMAMSNVVVRQRPERVRKEDSRQQLNIHHKRMEQGEEEVVSEQLPSIARSGPNYRQAMIESMVAANPSYKLTPGVNIFCAKPENRDMLCSVHATVTALMNMDSIKNKVASDIHGQTGHRLTNFTHSNVESEKLRAINILGEECANNGELDKNGMDAAEVMDTMLNNLSFEGTAEDDVFTQHLEASSICVSCGGQRKTLRYKFVSVKYNTKMDDYQRKNGVCHNGPNCKDGAVYREELLNCPDTVVQVIASRGVPGTYKQIEEVPYEMSSRVKNMKYNLKFCIVHLGKSPMRGHFITILSNPLNRNDCALVDNGQVKWISRRVFEEFSRYGYIIGYELVQPRTISQPTSEDILTKMDESLKKKIRRDRALKKITLLDSITEYFDQCEHMIRTSFVPMDAKEALIKLVLCGTCRQKNHQFLEEEVVANELAWILCDKIKNCRPKWNVFKKLKSFFGLYNSDETDRHLNHIKMLCKRRMEKKYHLPSSTAVVLGTGVDQNRDNKDTFNKHVEILPSSSLHDPPTYKCLKCSFVSDKPQMKQHIKEGFCSLLESVHVEILKRKDGQPEAYKCHCCSLQLSLLQKHEMQIHLDQGRCSVLRKIDKHYRITPRNIGTGVWWNENVKLRIIRCHHTGNRTRISLEDQAGNIFSSFFETRSPLNLENGKDSGVNTDDGRVWYGQGYVDGKENTLTAWREVIEDGVDIGDNKNYRIYSLMGQVFEVTPDKIQKTRTGCILNVEKHPADNPNNRKLVDELQLILVVSENCPKNIFKMVLRRRGVADEELTYFRQLRYSEENPGGDDLQYNRVAISMLRHCITRKGLPEVKQFSANCHQYNMPFKFMNPGDNLCWVNSSTNAFFHSTPNVTRYLRQTMNEPSDSSAKRDLTRMLLEISTKSQHQQSLNQLRYLLDPQRHEKSGPALQFLENIIEGLKSETPAAIEQFRIEYQLTEKANQCPTEGCSGTLSSSTRIIQRDMHVWYHSEKYDGVNAQKAIDRSNGYLEKFVTRLCTKGHSSLIKKNVEYLKMPDVFFVNARDGVLEQKTSIDVELVGTRYRANAIIHHMRGNPGHHYCSLWIHQKKNWIQVDDFHGGPNWQRPYYFDRKEKVYKCGGHKLFDNLGVVVYERIGKESIIEEPEINREGTSSNWHTRTKSGQQIFISMNKLNECYAIQVGNFLLSCPYMHHLLRTWPPQDCNRLENHLRTLCYYSPTTIAPNTLVIRQLNTSELHNFASDRQQDAMEFLTTILQNIRIKNETNANGEIIRASPVSTDVLGYTFYTRTWCTLPGCTRNVEMRTPELVLHIDILGASVNDCIRLQLDLLQPIFPERCDTCLSTEAEYKRRTQVIDLKKCVIVQLKRFGNEGKKHDQVIGDEVLQQQPLKGYELTCVILHRGETMESGHYIGLVRDVVDHTWTLCNDNQATSLRGEEARAMIRDMGYIFFYADPSRYPAALKSDKKSQHVPKTDSVRKEQKHRKRSSATSSSFNVNDIPTNKKSRLSGLPCTSTVNKNFIKHTPSAEEISSNLKATSGNQTNERIIDRTDPLYDVLKRSFGHDDFRSVEQLAATRAVIEQKNDVLVLFPTG